MLAWAKPFNKAGVVNMSHHVSSLIMSRFILAEKCRVGFAAKLAITMSSSCRRLKGKKRRLYDLEVGVIHSTWKLVIFLEIPP